MRKTSILCLALCAILVACTKEEDSTNVTPEPTSTPAGTGSTSDSANYFIKTKINGASWECRGLGALAIRQHVGTGSDTLSTYSGQANVAGKFMRIYVRVMNFTDTGYIDNTKLTLEVRPLTGDKDYNDSHIYTTKTFNLGSTWGDIEHDNDTTIRGVFSGMVYTDDLKDSLE